MNGGRTGGRPPLQWPSVPLAPLSSALTPPAARRHRSAADPWAALLLALACLACSEERGEVAAFEPPAEYVTSILRSEAAAHRIQGVVDDALEGLGPDGLDGLRRVFTPGAVMRFPAPEPEEVLDGHLARIEVHGAGAGDTIGAADFLERLEAYLEGWSTIERRQFELDQFFLGLDGARANGRAELYLAGALAEGGRADLRARFNGVFTETNGTWRIAGLELLDAVASSSPAPAFVDVTDAVGLHYLESDLNREMLQAFIDEHRVLALGGLSALDWNDDGLPDLVGSVDTSQAVLFLNDGRGGFVRRKLPVDEPNDCGIFLLVLDLDNDGVPEIASSKVNRYEGTRASCGLYVRDGDGWEFRPDAFEFELPLGMRGVALQTIVPFDANGDGLLDLFMGAYGHQESRSERYNLVEAHDGGDNYLFINQGDLQFSEESEERGITGTQYTYIGLAHDVDGDGDVDLLEGNDFGPNVLWENQGEGVFREKGDSVFEGVSAYTMGASLADHDDDGRLSIYVVNMSSEPGSRISNIAEGISDHMRERVSMLAGGNALYTQEADGSWREHAVSSGCMEGEWGWGAVFFDLDGDGDDELFATNGFTSHSDPDAPDWEPYFWRQIAADGASMERGQRTHDVNEGLTFRGSYAGRQRDRLYVTTEGDSERFFNLAWHLGLDNDWDGRCVAPLDVDGDGDLDLVLWTLQGLRLLENRMEPRAFARVELRATEGAPCALGARVTLTAGGVEQHDVVQVVEGFQTQVPLELHFGLADAEVVDGLRVTWPSGRVQEWGAQPVGKRLLLIEGQEAAQVRELPSWPDTTPSLIELQELARSAWPADRRGRSVVVAHTDGAGLGLPDELRGLVEEAALVDLVIRQSGAEPGVLFVYDPHGRLRRVFREPPAAEDLAALIEGLADEQPFPELSVLTGRREIDHGNHERALAYFRAAQAVDPELASAAEGIARSQRMLGNLPAAEAAYEQSVRIDADYAIGHFNLGVIRSRTGRPEEGIEAFQEALRIQGDRVETLLALAEAQILARRPEEALGVLARATALAPDEPGPQVLRGKLLGQLERYSEAQAAFERALELDPELEEAQRGLRLVRKLLEGAQ